MELKGSKEKKKSSETGEIKITELDLGHSSQNPLGGIYFIEGGDIYAIF